MKIKTAIKQLLKCENQDADLHIVIGNDDNDIVDTTNFEILSDHSDQGYQDLFIHVDNVPEIKSETKQTYSRKQVEAMCSRAYMRGMSIQQHAGIIDRLAGMIDRLDKIVDLTMKRNGTLKKQGRKRKIRQTFTVWVKELIDTVHKHVKP